MNRFLGLVLAVLVATATGCGGGSGGKEASSGTPISELQRELENVKRQDEELARLNELDTVLKGNSSNLKDEAEKWLATQKDAVVKSREGSLKKAIELASATAEKK